MDPITMALIGQVANVGAQVTTALTQRKTAKEALEAQERNKYIKTFDFKPQTLEQDKTPIIVLGIMGGVLLVLAVVLVIKKTTK